MTLRIRPLVLSTLIAFSGEPSASVAMASRPFYLDKERGWFWREPIPAPPQTPTSAPPPREIPKAEKPPSSLPQEPAKATPPPLSAAWFRQNLDKVRDRAIDSPTRDNVAAFYYLQRVMMDKAHRFTDVARQVVMSDPLLDENTRRPIATFAVHESNRIAAKATEESLASVAKQAGLLFFFRSDCAYCHLQAPLLKLLEQRFGFRVYAVSLDGQPLPGDLYPDFHTDHGQAQLLGVQVTPALFLVKPPNGLLPLAQGLLSLDELTMRILTMAHAEGLLEDRQFDALRGQRSSQALIPPQAIREPPVPDEAAALIHWLQPGPSARRP